LLEPFFMTFYGLCFLAKEYNKSLHWPTGACQTFLVAVR